MIDRANKSATRISFQNKVLEYWVLDVIRRMSSSSRLDQRSEYQYFVSMNVGILFEKVEDKDFPPGYFYAQLPSLGLTTHGLGLEGARQAALDLARVWLAEKKAQGDPLPASLD